MGTPAAIREGRGNTMRRSLPLRTILMSSICLSSAAALAGPPKVGDRVLAARGRTNSFFIATVTKASELDGGSVKFLDGTEQNYGPITFEPSVRPLDWKVGSHLECSADPKITAVVG